MVRERPGARRVESAVCCWVWALALAACAPKSDRDAGDAALAPSDEGPDAISDVAAMSTDAPVIDAALDASTIEGSTLDVSTIDASTIDAPTITDATDATEASSTEPCATPGLRSCAGRCVDLASDLTNCGVCGAVCATAVHATAACNAGECERVCDRGYGDCDGDFANGCESQLATREHCGVCGRACAASEVCAAAACVPVDRAPPPQLFAPLSGTRVPARRPELRYVPLSGGSTAQVQVCRQRACTDVVATVESSNGRAQVPSALDPGVYFWRARAGTAGRFSSVYSPVWQFRVLARDTAAGYALGAEPDFNGDGLADVAVGAREVDRGTGEAYVFYGARTGPAATPDWRFRGADGPRSLAGARVTSVGDANGDGYTDLLVGVPDAAFYSGRALVFFGGPTGLPSAPSWVVPSPIGGGRLANQAAAAGDVDGDGYADFALGATGRGGGDGFVLVFRGGTGSSPLAALQQIAAPAGTTRFGETVAGLGDANGDGFGDLAVGAGGFDAVMSRSFVYSGTGSMLAPVAGLSTAGAAIADQGYDLAGASDVNGDGLGDLALNARYAGAASVYLGSPSGVSRGAAFSLAGCVGDVGGGGDVNGDGFDDLVFACGGEVSVVYGAAGSVGERRTMLRARAGATLTGARVTVVGDVNGDGFADVLVGVSEHDAFRGTVSLYLGAREGVSEAPAWFAVGLAAGDLFGDAIAGG